MTFHVQLTHRLDDGTRVQRDLADVADLGKSVTGAEDIGLTLAEAKALLGELQRVIVERQIEHYVAGRRHCPHGGRCRRLKGYLLPRAVPHRVRRRRAPKPAAVPLPMRAR